MAQIQVCQLSASTAHLRKSIALCREIKNEFDELIQCLLSPEAVPRNHIDFEIPFYDENFLQPEERVKLTKGKEWAAAERCLNEALRRCRKVNLVYHEPDILLAYARLLQVKKSPLAAVEKTLEEALDIAQRAGYRLKLADLHLFCGQVLLQSKEKQTLLGLTAHEHLEKTKEYALDVSESNNLSARDFGAGLAECPRTESFMEKRANFYSFLKESQISNLVFFSLSLFLLSFLPIFEYHCHIHWLFPFLLFSLHQQ